ncbi:hypothetical protein BACCOP_02636 [Phocaeicola coprocola DSM 17136]|uniref:Uncharacterized protein n=1 Tax=Phocaeicola coprocola DSM 17136 TaxID=470145 RepID=B3JL54_9BACT|nr:hypothetical protein BACCOP_02636 [Phocaeicola coprocola DSM 17136]
MFCVLLFEFVRNFACLSVILFCYKKDKLALLEYSVWKADRIININKLMC